MSSKRVLLGGILLVLALAVLIPTARLAIFAYSPLRPGNTELSVIEIQRGQGPKEIARQLTQAKAIDDPSAFIWLGKIMRQWKRIKSGEYGVSSKMTPIEIFSVITSGISIPHPVTVREGENMYEIADDVESQKLATKDRFILLCKDSKFISMLGFKDGQPPTLEGYLYPDTYFFNKTMSAEDMIRQMVRHFHFVWTDKEEARARALGMSRHQLITLASMIEKETGAPQERPLIGSVFYNRLKKGMRLQSDPTTIYGMWDRYEGKIHRSDLLAANAYNTYYVPALPAGPISNPGKEAIQAALYPASSDFLYFVSHNDGTHQFSRSLEEHNSAVRKFQLDPKAREGKSWRDLSKKLANPK